jgi:hypothetical protein
LRGTRLVEDSGEELTERDKLIVFGLANSLLEVELKLKLFRGEKV